MPFPSVVIGQSHQTGRTEDSNSKLVQTVNKTNSNSKTTQCLPQILQEVNVRGLMLHHDNASSHSARLTLEFLEQKQIKVIEHPPYSPDLAMCDFWLFFNLKKN